MVKVIKRGTPPQYKSYLFTCNNCRSELQAKMSEFTRTKDNQPGQRQMLRIICPVCNLYVYVSAYGLKAAKD